MVLKEYVPRAGSQCDEEGRKEDVPKKLSFINLADGARDQCLCQQDNGQLGVPDIKKSIRTQSDHVRLLNWACPTSTRVGGGDLARNSRRRHVGSRRV